MKKFYITTAISYPNSAPHLGHALEIVQTDMIARFQKILGKEVFFQTGTDEHGTKNWKCAKEAGKDIKDFLDANVEVFKELYAKLNVSYDYFIRTTDKEIHHPGAIKLWKELVKSGDIYKKKYKGIYCSGCESFKTERELEKGKCSNHPTLNLETVEEENYFFKLSKYKDQVYRKIESDDYMVVPESRKNEILSFLKGAKDISFSRHKSSLPWGIPVPDDDEQVMYVWCDALSNYITGAGYGRDDEEFKKRWPADVHVIGKDILRFHAGFWPAMLLSAGIELPKNLLVHGFILSKGSKMGKSTGNVVDPFDQIEKYGEEQFRFFIAGSMPTGADGEYSEALLVERVNSELVGNVANFCHRVLSFLNNYFDSKLGSEIDEEFASLINRRSKEAIKHYEEFDLKKALNKILEISSEGNKYFQEKRPWVTSKTSKKECLKTLTTCANLVKNISILLKPILPRFASGIEEQLNLSDLKIENLGFDLADHEIGEARHIYENIKEVKIIEESGLSKLNLRVGEVVEAQHHPNADKLFVLKVDLGGEERQIVSGLKGFYEDSEIKGKKVVVLTNLENADFRGETSEGMLLTAETKEEGELKVGLLYVEESEPGEQVLVKNSKPGKEKIKFKEFQKIKMQAKQGRIYFGEEMLKTSKEFVKVEKVPDGKVC